ncbi:hypothetical protein H8356DRAFT_1648094 [Neocallimastix lanati (nom. inval.)]|nr:hypothetical protein H8356DRAFT_1648094 [Neocallimastix sp. JGI-2020a]
MKIAFCSLFITSLLLSNIKASSINKCSDCNVYATGKDGTLWGWEDGSFCKLSSSCSETKKTTSKKTTTIHKKTSTNSISSSKKSTTKKSSTTSKNTTSSTKNESTSITTSSSKNESTSITTSSSKNESTSITTSSATLTEHETDANGNLVCNGCVVTSTGGDNSLWGYEDEKSCIIDQIKCKDKMEEIKNNKTNSKAESNHKKDSIGNLICNECKVTATGNDGSYWGWEDEASCIVDNVKCNLSPQKTEQKVLERGPDGILICSTCEYTRIDPDTTTWNTENGEDCRVIGSRCGINTTPHPWCSGCVVTGTGNDGALYGWENNASCLINEVSCGIVSNYNKYGQVTSDGTTQQKMTFLYGIIASLVTVFIVRGL